MFEAKLPIGVWNAVVNVIADIRDDVKFSPTEDGMKCKAMGPAHACTVEVNILPQAFSLYSRQDLEPFAVNLMKIQEFLFPLMKFIDKKMPVHLSIGEVRDRLSLHMKMGEQLTRSIGLLNYELEEPEIPKPDTKASISLRPNCLKVALSLIEPAGDFVIFHITEEKFRIHYEREGDVDDIDYKVKTGEPWVKNIICGEPQNAIYALDYLTLICKNIPEEVEWAHLYFSTDHPLILAYKFGPQEAVVVTNLLAPRIECE